MAAGRGLAINGFAKVKAFNDSHLHHLFGPANDVGKFH